MNTEVESLWLEADSIQAANLSKIEFEATSGFEWKFIFNFNYFENVLIFKRKAD